MLNKKHIGRIYIGILDFPLLKLAECISVYCCTVRMQLFHLFEATIHHRLPAIIYQNDIISDSKDNREHCANDEILPRIREQSLDFLKFHFISHKLSLSHSLSLSLFLSPSLGIFHFPFSSLKPSNV